MLLITVPGTRWAVKTPAASGGPSDLQQCGDALEGQEGRFTECLGHGLGSKNRVFGCLTGGGSAGTTTD